MAVVVVRGPVRVVIVVEICTCLLPTPLETCDSNPKDIKGYIAFREVIVGFSIVCIILREGFIRVKFIFNSMGFVPNN